MLTFIIKTLVDLWAGAGGMSIGFEKAGFNVICAVDNDKDAVATLRANKKGCVMFQEKVSSFLRNSKQGKVGYPQQGEAKHVHGSPPCKGFSRANRNGGKDDFINNKVRESYVKVCLTGFVLLAYTFTYSANTLLLQGS